jgi:hypothetical protein
VRIPFSLSSLFVSWNALEQKLVLRQGVQIMLADVVL